MAGMLSSIQISNSHDCEILQEPNQYFIFLHKKPKNIEIAVVINKQGGYTINLIKQNLTHKK